MENKTNFDLNAALRQWSNELAGQAGLTPETRNELETHLRETVEEFCGRGINVEEAFWLARRRVGPPQELGEEFAKADPSLAWKMRGLTIAAALLAVHLIQGALTGVSGLMTFAQLHYAPTRTVEMSGPTLKFRGSDGSTMIAKDWKFRIPSAGTRELPWWMDGLRSGLHEPEVGDVIGAVGVIWLGILIARWPTGRTARLWRVLFKSKGRFLMAGTAGVLLVYGLERWSDGLSRALLAIDPDPSAFLASSGQDAFSKLMFPLALVVLIAWLVPGERMRKSMAIGSRASA